MDFFRRLLGGGSIAAISASEAGQRLRTQPAPFILDVRQPEEYRLGHIAGAMLIPLGELSQRLKDLPREREILCVCRSGNRSRSATQQLLAQGFKAVNLSGGMIAWEQAGLPVKKGAAK
ncbi:MAG: rhodanese-like domain-containing protein [Anaerolineae bacterium]|uniref:rhodanese-like domain-containing protein n=1 Tax=Candidatus Amarolinea dominans TaxID=3140696 RepID=UPI0031357525|nr:rhodanese-like domain-containing protein [Anaerolineae bacterium]MBK9096099.1 rhodanese-like domain-containing protein [Anaerolineae bacterium]MBK9233153.1 rhodanese-like domain-containing protein [Anaerolineae bacterium]